MIENQERIIEKWRELTNCYNRHARMNSSRDIFLRMLHLSANIICLIPTTESPKAWVQGQRILRRTFAWPFENILLEGIWRPSPSILNNPKDSNENLSVNIKQYLPKELGVANIPKLTPWSSSLVQRCSEMCHSYLHCGEDYCNVGTKFPRRNTDSHD